MEKQPLNQKPSSFRPVANRQCLCGSGKKYKRCCQDNLPIKVDGEKHYEQIELENYEKALAYCRAELTQYFIWVKSHTEPALLNGSLEGLPKFVDLDQLIDIDINALSDIVSRLMRTYFKIRNTGELHECLNNIRDNLKHDKWYRKISYFHVLAELGEEWDEEKGRRELQRLGSIEEETDVEIIQLYLDLRNHELTFTESIRYIDKILALDEKLSTQLHYKGAKSAELLSIHEDQEAIRVLEEVTNVFRQRRTQEKVSEYDLNSFAQNLELLGTLKEDTSLLLESLEIYKSLYDENVFKSSANALFRRKEGDIYKHLQDTENALSAYEKAYSTHPDEIYKVFIAECLLKLDKDQEAMALLTSIDNIKLNVSEYTDYVFAYSLMAIKLAEDSLINQAEVFLRKLDIRTPYFKGIKDSLLLSVVETKNKGAQGSIYKKAMKLLSQTTKSARKYLLIQPNVMGVGVNMNKLLDDIHGQIESDKDNKN